MSKKRIYLTGVNAKPFRNHDVGKYELKYKQKILKIKGYFYKHASLHFNK